ncbi:MAG: response regulator transcription factor [Bacteroidia bacterium]|nr:response regulator transcription factor [Bacteroidia bacterium]
MSEIESSINVLIVDDHQIVIDGIISMLSTNKRFVVKNFAHTAEEAWALISVNSHDYDLVITDISLAGKTGIRLCREVKNLDHRIKVLILTMHNDVACVKEALACEADGYLLKNNGRDDFLRALDSLIERGSCFSHEIVPLLYQEVNQSRLKQPDVKLTHREQEVLELILLELTSREIAEKLFISKQTVDSHRISLMEKTGSKSVVGLIKYALRNHLIDIN